MLPMDIVNQSETKALTPLEKYWDAAQDSIRPALEVQNKIRELFEPMAETIRQLEKNVLASINGDLIRQMQDSMSPLLEAQERIQELLKPVLESARQFEQNMVASVDWEQIRHIHDVFRRLQEEAKTLPERTRKALLIISQHGWFFDVQMPAISLWELQDNLTNGNVDEAERALIEYYRHNIADIVAKIKERFSKRAKPIDLAFKAHERGEYELSIPVFIAQADGICHELFGVQFCHLRYKEQPAKASNTLMTIAENEFKAFLHPLTQPLPISARSDERGTNFDELNRHQVLHGESVDYGSEVNSLKAISLLNYIAIVLNDYSQDADVTSAETSVKKAIQLS